MLNCKFVQLSWYEILWASNNGLLLVASNDRSRVEQETHKFAATFSREYRLAAQMRCDKVPRGD
jgi:hypothetical protein